jgi:acetamidase/formamidase
VLLALLSPALISAGGPPPTTHRLDPSPATVVWGYYDAAAKPALRVRSGDTVVVRTLTTSTPERLEKAGVRPEDVEPALREINKNVTKGPGNHILTGPIFVVLEVHFEKIDLAIPYASNRFAPMRGFLPEDFPYARERIVPLDARAMVGHFAPGIDIPLHPFFGSVGVAPPPGMGRVDSAPPYVHAGNLDNKNLVAGTVLSIPVHTPGALLEVGDGHAAQGDGEVDITALETSLIGTLRLVVRKDVHLTWPRAETPTHFITMGTDKDFVQAAKIAVREAIAFLMAARGLSKDDAYMLVSVSCDVAVTQLVDGNVGAHVMIPKTILVGAALRTER